MVRFFDIPGTRFGAARDKKKETEIHFSGNLCSE